ncbi:MAG: zinc-binding dehydrogenase [Propionibacteriales bacterium]|nr:zinc-binding dehydrogenase [Propionibacteriales bacterium]
MWAYRLEGPLRFARHEIDAPDPASLRPGGVLLRFLAGGICGSDVPRCWDGSGGGEGSAPFGFSLHEIVGEVVASESDLQVGERVVGWVDGSEGLREYVVTPANMVLPIDSDLDDVHAIPLQPLACVLYALSRLPDIRGARAAVIGLGPIGLLFAHALKDGGAAHVHGVDVVDRSEVASTYGLDDFTQHTSRTWSHTPGLRDSFDLVVEAVGHQVGTLDDGITAAAPGGTIVYFGNPDELYYPIRFGEMMDKHLTLQTGRTPVGERRDALRLAQKYVARYPDLPGEYVTDALPVSAAQAAYETASRPARGRLKVVIDGTA